MNAVVSKTIGRASVSGVRISPSPPVFPTRYRQFAPFSERTPQWPHSTGVFLHPDEYPGCSIDEKKDRVSSLLSIPLYFCPENKKAGCCGTDYLPDGVIHGDLQPGRPGLMGRRLGAPIGARAFAQRNSARPPRPRLQTSAASGRSRCRIRPRPGPNGRTKRACPAPRCSQASWTKCGRTSR